MVLFPVISSFEGKAILKFFFTFPSAENQNFEQCFKITKFLNNAKVLMLFIKGTSGQPGIIGQGLYTAVDGVSPFKYPLSEKTYMPP